MYHTILTSCSWCDTTNYLWGVFLIPYGSWSANQLMHNISVRMWISWYVLQPIHNICVRICVRLCHRMSCDGPLIEQSLVTFVITTRVITSKTESTINNNSLHVKTFYQTHWTLHCCPYRDEEKETPQNINRIRGNVTGLHEVTPLNIKSTRRNFQRTTPIPKYWRI